MALGAFKLRSPLKILPVLMANPALAMGAVQGITGILGGMSAGRAAKREQRTATAAMDKSRRAWESAEIKNPYADLQNPYAENVYEDLTVNQQQAQFEAQQAAQSRADVMQGMRGAAGGSGVAGLAQAMANQGAISAQRASASIGMQEAQNQRLMAQGAQQVQAGEGEAQRMRMYGADLQATREQQRRADLYGMDMQRVTAANEARAAARKQVMGGIGSLAGAAVGVGAKGGFDKFLPPSLSSAGTQQSLIADQGIDFQNDVAYQQGSGPDEFGWLGLAQQPIPFIK